MLWTILKILKCLIASGLNIHCLSQVNTKDFRPGLRETPFLDMGLGIGGLRVTEVRLIEKISRIVSLCGHRLEYEGVRLNDVVILPNLSFLILTLKNAMKKTMLWSWLSWSL